MNKEIDIIQLLEEAFANEEQTKLEEIGTVVRVGDNIASVYGLNGALYGEIIRFETGDQGIALDLDEHFVSVVLLDKTNSVSEHTKAFRTEKTLHIPVGEKIIGRVVNARGLAIDGLGPIQTDTTRPIEREAPGIIQRKPINRPFETGIIAIDALIPIGRGQRELLVGNRSTGKTSIVLDIILNQHDKNVVCIYVSIGHKQADTARIINLLEQNNAMEYSIVVTADAHDSALHQFISPYTACAIGEYFMDQGRDVLIIYDDLSNHAVAYRELSLLLRRPPGREAYPGDIFYIHSRLLERAAQLSDALGGGSLTALPVAQLQGDDIAAYIPTNLISITDGQILLDSNLFNQGVRPAINIGLSVSRVGGAAQYPATKKLAGQLRLELAQYEDLQAFLQFGSELDKESKQKLDRGQRAVELIKQNRYDLYSFANQTILLFLLNYGYLDKFKLEDIHDVTQKFSSFIKEMYNELYTQIASTHVLSDQTLSKLKTIADDFCTVFRHSNND
ncbi:F0F1 ATP synthase subunit alpha [Candidatus Dependentiae bacterium]|nr:F0F1 ATP synthase subunit alpha [Candidatus Dependentiae bacterium]